MNEAAASLRWHEALFQLGNWQVWRCNIHIWIPAAVILRMRELLSLVEVSDRLLRCKPVCLKCNGRPASLT